MLNFYKLIEHIIKKKSEIWLTDEIIRLLLNNLQKFKQYLSIQEAKQQGHQESL